MTPCYSSPQKLQVANESSVSGIISSNQVSLYEERLEDMRQELVRQDQEHQQATEILKQGHMQQMERQKENQEQLLAELDRLKVQLAEVMGALKHRRARTMDLRPAPMGFFYIPYFIYKLNRSVLLE